MKKLVDFVLESKRENRINESEAYSWLYNVYSNIDITKDKALSSLKWLKDNVKVLKGFEEYLVNIDTTKTAWTYMASDDDFLDKEKLDDIISRLADYIVEKL